MINKPGNRPSHSPVGQNRPDRRIGTSDTSPSAKSAVTDLHKHSDVDFDRTSQHHTLGSGPSQAAPGNHTHAEHFNTGDLKSSFVEGDGVSWLTLNGDDVSRTDYADLFALFGTTYGVGDGSTTFGLPDATGALLMGAAPADVGDFAGDADNSITLTVGQLPSHNHDMAHTHSIGTRSNSTAGTAAVMEGSVSGSASTKNTNASSAANTGNTGSGNPIDITPYHLKVFWLVKV